MIILKQLEKKNKSIQIFPFVMKDVEIDSIARYSNHFANFTQHSKTQRSLSLM